MNNIKFPKKRNLNGIENFMDTYPKHTKTSARGNFKCGKRPSSTSASTFSVTSGSI